MQGEPRGCAADCFVPPTFQLAWWLVSFSKVENRKLDPLTPFGCGLQIRLSIMIHETLLEMAPQLPDTILLDTTNFCNARCPFCPLFVGEWQVDRRGRP